MYVYYELVSLVHIYLISNRHSFLMKYKALNNQSAHAYQLFTCMPQHQVRGGVYR